MVSLIRTLGIDRLSTAERMQIMRELLDSLAPEAEAPPLPASQRDELDRRIAAIDAGTVQMSPWDEVEARVLARITS